MKSLISAEPHFNHQALATIQLLSLVLEGIETTVGIPKSNNPLFSVFNFNMTTLKALGATLDEVNNHDAECIVAHLDTIEPELTGHKVQQHLYQALSFVERFYVFDTQPYRKNTVLEGMPESVVLANLHYLKDTIVQSWQPHNRHCDLYLFGFESQGEPFSVMTFGQDEEDAYRKANALYLANGGSDEGVTLSLHLPFFIK